MGKYTDIKSEPGNDIAWMLQILANELAEANRLKRLELSQFLEYSKFIPKKELEDQA